MLAVAIPFSPHTSPPSPPLSTSPTLWRSSSSPSRFLFSTSTSSTTLFVSSPLPRSASPALIRLPSTSPYEAEPVTFDCPASRFSLDCPSPTLPPFPSPSSSQSVWSCPSSPAPPSSPFPSRRVSHYLRHLPPIAQHHFYHWLHIRSLYESQFTYYVAAGGLLPLDIHSETVSSSQPITADSYRVHLTTTTTTVMPHATATTATSTSYRQLTSDVLCLPPSPPLLALAGYTPPAPFSYDFTYPSHPFSYPPTAVLEALPAEMRDAECWGSLDVEDEADTEQEEQEEDEEEEEDEAADTRPAQQPQCETEPRPSEGKAESGGKRDAEAGGDRADDSDDEWSTGAADDEVTEIDLRSSYAPSYATSYACSDAEAEAEEDEDEEEQATAEVRAAASGAERRRVRQAATVGLLSR